MNEFVFACKRVPPVLGALVAFLGSLLSQAVAQTPAPPFPTYAGSTSTSTNQASPLGINLTGVSYYSPEQPFLNIFKTAPGWAGRNASPNPADTSAVNVDANGWVKS